MALTIRTTPEQDKQIAKLTKQLGFNASTKLFFHLLNTYDDTQDEINNLKREVVDLKLKLSKSESVVSDFQKSFQNLMSHKS